MVLYFELNSPHGINRRRPKNGISQASVCPLPTCPGIYKMDADTQESACLTCYLIICLAYKVSHNPMSCSGYTMLLLPVDSVRLKIIDEILTLRCSRFLRAFFDFDGCFALACGACPCQFCGWCLEDCGANAHPHVSLCPQKESNADTCFGTKEQFDIAQNKNRQNKLLDFLNNYPTEDRRNIVKNISKDFKDLRITLWS